MKTPSNRLATNAEGKLQGHCVDKNRPVSFTLNGRTFDALAGDTVLSALLANDIMSAGSHNGAPIALDERFCPPVGLADTSDPLEFAAPMAFLPVSDGMELVTVGTSTPRPKPYPLRLFHRQLEQSLGLDFDRRPIEFRPWIGAVAKAEFEADFAIIGAGPAGLAAAVAALEQGCSAIVIEQRSYAGGLAELFGSTEHDPDATEEIEHLLNIIRTAEGLSLLTGTQAFGMNGEHVLARQITPDKGLMARNIMVRAKHTVLATGAEDAVPIFPGNRLPGVTQLASAFHLAAAYGVWSRHPAVVATVSNIGYRIAVMAKDAGADIKRVNDARLDPNSRHREFAKAYGISIASALKPVSAARHERGRGLELGFRLPSEWSGNEDVSMTAGMFVASGAWQPKLALWAEAGGRLSWRPERGVLMAEGTLEGIRIAGSAAGYESLSACLASGRKAVRNSLGLIAEPVEERHIEEIFESRDGITPAEAGNQAAPPHAYLSATISPATSRKEDEARSWHLPRRAPARAKAPVDGNLVALSPDDLAGKLLLAEIEPHDLAALSAERCIPARLLTAPGNQGRPAGQAENTQTPEDGEDWAVIPLYLRGRFGQSPAVREIFAKDGRSFETGCLIFQNTDETDPASAIGVVLGPSGASGKACALISRDALLSDARLRVRSGGAAVLSQVSPNGSGADGRQ